MHKSNGEISMKSLRDFTGLENIMKCKVKQQKTSVKDINNNTLKQICKKIQQEKNTYYFKLMLLQRLPIKYDNVFFYFSIFYSPFTSSHFP